MSKLSEFFNDMPLSNSAGLVIPFANFPDLPDGFLLCNGSAVSRTTYADLFTAIGTRYGSGDGSTTFNLPRERSEFTGWVQGTPIPSEIVSRYGSASVLLQDGRVLVIGGYSGSAALASTFFMSIDGVSITYTASTDYPIALCHTTAQLLPDGRVLVVGGQNSAGNPIANTYIGTISGNSITWVAATAYPYAMLALNSVMLTDGRILCAGGYTTAFSAYVAFGTVSGNTITWSAGTVVPVAVDHRRITQLSDGRVFCAGGLSAGGGSASAWFGSISGNTITWVSPATAMPAAMSGAVVAPLKDGRVIVAGGSASVNAAYVCNWNPDSNTIDWETWSGESVASAYTSGHVLPDGRLLVISGYISAGVATASVRFVTSSTKGIKT